jgi:biopolymer transport protein ExbD
VFENPCPRGFCFEEMRWKNLDPSKHKFMALLRSEPDAYVIINGDKNVRYDSVIKVIDGLT